MPQDGSPANLNIFFKGKEVKKQQHHTAFGCIYSVCLYDFYMELSI